MRACIVANDDLDLADDWHVLGMRGTGSVDFAADDVFVPAEMTYSASAPTAPRWPGLPHRDHRLPRLPAAGGHPGHRPARRSTS